MSDVGLGANLELSIAEALRRVDELGRRIADTLSGIPVLVDTSRVAPEITRAVDAADSSVLVDADATEVAPEITAAVDAADTGFVVDADTSSVAPEIDAAVDAADTGVAVTADSSEVTGSIDGAVDAADTNVIVTGDATELTGAITGAVDAADSHVIVTGDATELTGEVDSAIDNANERAHITVTGGIDPGLSTGVEFLGDSLDAASESGARLKTILGGLGLAAVATSMFQAAQAASDLAESSSKASVVFGTGFQDIQTFSVEAAEAIGLSEQAALEAAGTFGNLFQALGASQQVATDLSPKILTLASDLASFNNLGTDEVLEKLRSGLVGEIEPLRALGISFGAAEVEAKAFELGLAEAGAEVSEGAKLQARYALIMEQTTLAQGDFARTSEGLANQQRILSAEFDNAVASVGQALLPALLELVGVAREDLIPGLSQLAETVLPAFASILSDLAPLLGTTVDLLVVLSPLIEAFATAVDAIPTPLIQMAGTLLIAHKAMSLLSAATVGLPAALRALPALLTGTQAAAIAASAPTGALAKGITGIGTAVGGLSIPLLAGAALIGGIAKTFMDAQDRAADVDRQVSAMGDSFAKVGTDFETGREALQAWLDGLAESGDKVEFQIGILDELDLTVANLTKMLGIGTAELSRLAAQGPEAINAFASSLGDLSDSEKVAVAGLLELSEQSAEAAENTLNAQAATGALTSAFEDELDALNARNAPAEDYIDLLDRSTRAQAAAAAEAERTVAAYGPLADQFVNTGEALTRLRDEAPLLANGIASIRTGTDQTEASLLNMALALGEAELSEEGMADAAALLGTDVGTLTDLIDRASESLETFVDTATDALPTLGDAFQNVGDDSKLSVREFIDGLNASADEMEAFTFRLAVLTQAGFGELAGIIAQQGPEVGGALVSELVTAISEGHEEIVEEAQAAVDTFNQKWEDANAFFRDTLGPEFILSAGLLGEGLTEAFGAGLSFEERMRIAGELAANELDSQGDAIAAVAAVEGEDAARSYGKALNLPKETIDAAVAAGLAIAKKPPEPGWKAGGEARGSQFGEGVAIGISGKALRVYLASQGLSRQAIIGASKLLEESSPSKVAMEIGGFFGEGFAIGIEDSTAEVVAAAEAIARDAAAAIATTEFDPVTIPIAPVTADVARAAAGLTGIDSRTPGSEPTTITFDVTVNPPAGMTTAEAAELGEAIVVGAQERLMERRLSVLSRTL